MPILSTTLQRQSDVQSAASQYTAGQPLGLSILSIVGLRIASYIVPSLAAVCADMLWPSTRLQHFKGQTDIRSAASQSD